MKKLNNKGFSHVELIIAVVVVAVVAGAGFFVYKHQNKAHASNWTTLAIGNPNVKGISAVACKSVINSAFGPLYKVQVDITRTNHSYTTIHVNVDRPQATGGFNTVSTHDYNSWLYNTYSDIDALASVPLKDSVLVGIGTSAADPGWPLDNPSRPADNGLLPQYLANC